MLSKEDWIASHRKQFPDARPDVLGFIYDFSSRIGAVGSGLSLVPWQVGTFISKSSLR